MTATIIKACDVFISHSAADSNVALEVAESLDAVGLQTFHMGTIQPGEDISEAIWEAIAESRALIVVVSPEIAMQAMRFIETGAAMAWNKPIYVLLNGPATTKLPGGLSQYPVYPLNRLDEVIQAIRTSFEPLTDDERNILADVYKDMATPADQLNQSAKLLRHLTTEFNKRTHKALSGERLLSEILRMRKKSYLPRL